MNHQRRDSLDLLLGDWSAAREADQLHVEQLADRIVSAALRQEDSIVDASPAVNAFLQTVVHRESTSTADFGGKLMIGGGGLLLFLIMAGGVLWYNLATAPTRISKRSAAVASSSSGATAATTTNHDPPHHAMLDAGIVAAKRQLFSETNATFDDQLAWLVESECEVSLEVGERAAAGDRSFLLVRVVVAQRASPDSPWTPQWQADVISRSETFVEVVPRQLGGSSLTLWTYYMPDGQVAVDMDLTLDEQIPLHTSSSMVLRAGEPVRVDCSSEDGVEHCVFQTVMSLDDSRI